MQRVKESWSVVFEKSCDCANNERDCVLCLAGAPQSPAVERAAWVSSRIGDHRRIPRAALQSFLFFCSFDVGLFVCVYSLTTPTNPNIEGGRIQAALTPPFDAALTLLLMRFFLSFYFYLHSLCVFPLTPLPRTKVEGGRIQAATAAAALPAR